MRRSITTPLDGMLPDFLSPFPFLAPAMQATKNQTFWHFHSLPMQHHRCFSLETNFYNPFLLYTVDRSVLLENTPLVKFIRNYIRDPSGVFSISSLVRILMTSFPALSRPFGTNNRWKMARDRLVYIIKRKLHSDLNIWIWFSRVKTIFYSLAALVRKILSLPLKNKIHIFAPPCTVNILYIHCMSWSGLLHVMQWMYDVDC